MKDPYYDDFDLKIHIGVSDFRRLWETSHFVWSFLDYFGDPHVCVIENRKLADSWTGLPVDRLFVPAKKLGEEGDKVHVRIYFNLPHTLVPDAAEVWLPKSQVEVL